jgi:two-component system, NtrC family, sensor histidine kinase KinB
MQDSLALSLPPMRRKILRSFLTMVAIYGLLGVVLVSAVFLASGITPRAMHMNYDSIAASHGMLEAWRGLRHPSAHSTRTFEEWADQFEKDLKFEEGNISEPGEAAAARTIRSIWNEQKKELPEISRKKGTDAAPSLEGALKDLVVLNEKGMFNLAEESTRVRREVFIVAIVIFFATLFFAVYTADGLASRLSSPLKEIAEALRNKPIPGEKLRLPTPSSLEMRILTHEMNQLWKRLSELRKLNVEEIATQRSKLEIVLEAVEDGILVIDNSGNVVQANQGLLKILGLPSDLVMGHKWEDLPTSDEGYLKLREVLSPAMPQDNSVDLSAESRAYTFAVRTRTISNKMGDIIANLYLLHDITDRNQRERLKTEFISVLSHELKTPLQSLGTAAELLLKRKEAFNEENRMLIETVYEDVTRIRAVAQDFVQIGLVDSRYLRLRVARHALSELIQEWVKPFKILAKDKNVNLEFIQHTVGVVWVNIDAVKFPWAISNLLSNAIRFSPNGTTVRVILSETEAAISIEIRDEGPGIPEPMRKKMFDPYFQAPPVDSKIPAGFLGLGLTIAKEVVEAHQGKLDYLPGDPKGAIFRIILPRLPEVEVV